MSEQMELEENKTREHWNGCLPFYLVMGRILAVVPCVSFATDIQERQFWNSNQEKSSSSVKKVWEEPF